MKCLHTHQTGFNHATAPYSPNSLKDYYRSTAQDLMGQFPGIITSRSNFARIFASAWKKAMTPSNIKSGFKSCRIYPFNPQAIPSDAYLPNYL